MAFKMDISKVINNLTGMKAKLLIASQVYGETAAAKLESYAKSNAPWHDITSNSRQTIQGDSAVVGNRVRISLTGNTPQFPYLELAHEKKYAILWPTIQAKQQEVVSGWNKVMMK